MSRSGVRCWLAVCLAGLLALWAPGAVGDARGEAVASEAPRLTGWPEAAPRPLEPAGPGVRPITEGGRGQAAAPAAAGAARAAPGSARMEIFNGYIGVLLAAFVVSVLVTPVMRRLALSMGIIDRPDEARKQHRFPIAYLGGLAVYLGIMGGLAYFLIAERWPELHLMTPHESAHPPPGPGPMIAIIFGLTVILLVGLLDDVVNVRPIQKVGGILIAAAALATQDVGTRVAAQVMTPIGEWLGNPALTWTIPVGGFGITFDLIYWTGIAVIAIFCLGACNAMNLIDGLDGLCSGVGAIAAAAILFIAVRLAAEDNGPLNGVTIVVSMAVLGACLGFLPHNFNPAVIFLGDAGSLMLGYALITLVLLMGHTGQTNLVLAGLVIFAVPIMDTALAIVRRKLAGQPISAADDQHLHHILKRSLGVKGAVLVLYLLGGLFGLLGILLSQSASRLTYTVTIVLALFIGMTAIKVARRKIFEEQAARLRAAEAAGLVPSGGPARPGGVAGPGGATGDPARSGAPPEGRQTGGVGPGGGPSPGVAARS